MKREKLWNSLTGLVLAWMLSAAAVGCMVTAFDLNAERFGGLLLFCGGISAFAVVCLCLRWGDWLLAGVLALSAGYLWHEGTVWSHASALLRCVTRRYDMAYGWGIVSLKGFDGSGSADLALGIIACAVMLSVCWVVLRRKSVLWALPVVLAPLVSCLVVTDTVPSPLWLYLMMLGVVILLLTDYTRRKGKRQSAMLAAYAALPAAAALGLLFLLVPQKSYVNQAGRYQQVLRAWTEGMLTLAEDTAEDIAEGLSGETGEEKVDLSRIGPRIEWNQIVMDVTYSAGGTLYLRDQDYDSYSGTGWTASRRRREEFGGGAEIGTVTIRTRRKLSMLLVPYYPASAQVLIGGGTENEEKLTEYTWSVAGMPQRQESGEGIEFPMGVMSIDELSRQADQQELCALPIRTQEWAKELAEQITAGQHSDGDRARAIADYVRNSADYDLNTARMPAEETDFARWFLEESDTGYCVHFATAAAVLLRAAGIPSRYVTGYLVSAPAGETVGVPAQAAHAWAEYYDASRDAWVVLEATPAGSPDETPVQTAPSQQTAGEQVTRPPETEESTIPEAAGEAEQPAENREFRFTLPGWLKALLRCLLVLGILLGQSILRVRYRRARRSRGTPKEQALTRWTQACRMARLLGEEEPAQLRELAEKACYSQHSLTAEELAVFDRWDREAQARIREKNVFLKLFWRIVYGI